LDAVANRVLGNTETVHPSVRHTLQCQKVKRNNNNYNAVLDNSYHIDNNVLPEVTSCRDLGVTINDLSPTCPLDHLKQNEHKLYKDQGDDPGSSGKVSPSTVI